LTNGVYPVRKYYKGKTQEDNFPKTNQPGTKKILFPHCPIPKESRKKDFLNLEPTNLVEHSLISIA